MASNETIVNGLFDRVWPIGPKAFLLPDEVHQVCFCKSSCLVTTVAVEDAEYSVFNILLATKVDEWKFIFKIGFDYKNLQIDLIKFTSATSSIYFLPPRSASAETFKFQHEEPVVVVSVVIFEIEMSWVVFIKVLKYSVLIYLNSRSTLSHAWNQNLNNW